MSDINKRFPADTQMEALTFLNDGKVNGELYALLQSMSYPVKQADGSVKTIVYKKDMPTQGEMCKKLGIKSPKTYRTHLNYLIKDRGLVNEIEGGYELPNQESIFFMIPLETLKYLNDTVTQLVIKIFIYLGQRWKYKPGYVFTNEEIAQHIGVKLEGQIRHAESINNALDILTKIGLISFVRFYEEGKPRKRLTNFSLIVPHNDG